MVEAVDVADDPAAAWEKPGGPSLLAQVAILARSEQVLRALLLDAEDADAPGVAVATMVHAVAESWQPRVAVAGTKRMTMIQAGVSDCAPTATGGRPSGLGAGWTD